MQPPQLPAQAVPAEPDAPAPEPEAKAEELAAWERFAVKRLGKGGRDFEPRVLDLFTAGRIAASLKAATTEAEVRRVFAAEREPANMAQAALLLAAEIKAAREALGT